MLLKKTNTNEEIVTNRDWKEKNQRYLRHLQKFLDATDRIKDEKLRNHIIAQMLKCDQALTEIAEKEMEKRTNKQV